MEALAKQRSTRAPSTGGAGQSNAQLTTQTGQASHPFSLETDSTIAFQMAPAQNFLGASQQMTPIMPSDAASQSMQPETRIDSQMAPLANSATTDSSPSLATIGINVSGEASSEQSIPTNSDQDPITKEVEATSIRKENIDLEKSEETPKKSAKAQDDPQFVALIKDSKQVAKSQKKRTSSPEKKTGEAFNAIHVDDKGSISAGATVLTVAGNSETKSEEGFQVEKFKADLKRQISEAIPTDEAPAKAFIKDPSKLKTITNHTKTEIKNSEKGVVKNVETINSTSNASEQEKSAIPVGANVEYLPEEVGKKPIISDAARAIPKTLPPEDFQLDEAHDADSLDKEMEANKLSDSQLEESEEPKFLDALSEKKTSQEELRKIPDQLQLIEASKRQENLHKAKKTINGNVGQFYSAREEEFGNVSASQADVKKEGEEELEAYYVEIKGIYTRTQAGVSAVLKSLETQVSAIFQASIDVAFAIFKKNIKSRLEYYYDWHVFSRDYEKEDKFTRLRNSAVDSKIRKLTEKRDRYQQDNAEWKTTNQEIERLKEKQQKLIIEKTFDEEKDRFTNALDTAIDSIATLIVFGLNLAKTIISTGRNQVSAAYEKLDDKNKTEAATKTSDISSSFDDLEGKINEKANDLKEGLVKQYTENVSKLKDTFEEIRKEAALKWWERAWRKIKEIATIIYDIGKLLLNVLVKAASVIGDIIAHPIRFFGNLIDGVSLGFKQFIKRIPEHLENIMFKLILGVIPPGLALPEKWDAPGIFKFVLEFFGLSKENIREQAVTFFGESVVTSLESTFDLFILFKNEGFAGLWAHVQDKIGNLKDTILEEVKTFFQESIITAAIDFLLSALTPASGFIKVCKSIISVVKFFIKNLVNILKLLDSILDSFIDIAAGRIQDAANRVESALADILLIGIKFLAALVGINLEKIQAKITKIVEAVRNPVNRAIQWFFEKARLFAEKTGILAAIDNGKEKYNASKNWVSDKVEAGKNQVKATVKKTFQWFNLSKKFTLPNGENHEMYFEGKGADAKLKIASTPVNYLVWIAKLESNPKIPAASIAPLRAKAQEISVEKAKTVTQDQETDKNERIANLFNELVILTQNTPIPSNGNNTPAIYGPIYGDFGSLARVDSLADGHAEGSEANSSLFTTNYRIINARKQGSRAFYIRGHLLSWHLGGPGNDWQNLTPLFQNANADHERRFESRAKEHVNDNGKQASNFTVRAIYGRTISPWVAQIRDPEDDTWPTGLNQNEDLTQIANILEAEMMVPTSLECSIDLIQDDGTVRNVSVPVPNEISYGELSHYHTDGVARTDFNLTTTVQGAANDEAAIAALRALRGIGPVIAGKILERVKNNQRITNYLAQIGITKKRLEMLNPTKRIVQ